MAPRKNATVEIPEENDTEAPQLETVQPELTVVPDRKTRTRRSFNYNPAALGITEDTIEDEDPDFIPTRSTTKAKMEQVRWLEPILADTYERDVWKGATVPDDQVDAFKQGVQYGVTAFFENMGVSFTVKPVDNKPGHTRVSFKMKDKRQRRTRKPITGELSE